MLNIKELMEAVEGNLKAYAGISRKYEVEEFIAVLANEWFSVMTSYVVPFNAIVVEVVQNRQAGFIITLQHKQYVRAFDRSI